MVGSKGIISLIRQEDFFFVMFGTLSQKDFALPSSRERDC